MTDQRSAEAARDQAMRDLQELREGLERENLQLRKEIGLSGNDAGMVGESDALKYVFLKVEEVAETDATVLIQGETGVGKDLVARAIHQAGKRSGGPFVKVNCAALPENLVESELFGHEKGAFTGADRQRKGRFEQADGGTLLLDEVGELPPMVQAKLLHVLQDGEFERVGGSTISADVRVIAATNRDLAGDVESGRFRLDLFYRLNVYPITIPPLRQRPGDIPLLVSHFVNDATARMGKQITEVPAHVMQAFEDYEWPGNVRELQNVVERAVIASTSDVLQAADFLARSNARTATPARDTGTSLQTLAENERAHIVRALEGANWRVSGKGGAAELLDLNPSTLRFRMKKLGIRRG
jgi:chemotaxis protein methyltransferase CheR